MTTEKSLQSHISEETPFKQINREAFQPETNLAALAQQAKSNPKSLTSQNAMHLQRTIGNQALLGLMRIQRADDAESAPAATPVEAPVATDSYPDIDALDLNETAKAAAIALKKAFPDIVFTSGRREFSDQARVMAQNIVTDGHAWVAATYTPSEARTAIQKWLDDHKEANTQEVLEAGIKETLDSLTDSQKAGISKHPAGAAFDVQPQEKDAEAIKKAMKELVGATKFLEEGGLIRWHVQF